MSNEQYIAGTKAALEKFALSNDFISRAIMNKATQTGARVAPNLLNNLSGNRSALMSLAKNVRSPGVIAPTAGQNSLNKLLGKFDYFGTEMSGAAGPAQLPHLKSNLAMTGRVRNPSSPLQLEQNITQSFGPRPGPPKGPQDSIGTVAGTPKKKIRQNAGLQPGV